MNIHITTVVEGKAIKQEVMYVDDLSNTPAYISTQVAHTTEKEIASALIALGWTPPKDD